MFNVRIDRPVRFKGIPCNDPIDRDFNTVVAAERHARWHIARDPSLRAKIIQLSPAKRGWRIVCTVSSDALGRVWTDVQTAEAGRLL